MPSIECPFHETVDLGPTHITVAQCPMCGAYRTLRCSQHGNAYRFPSHKMVSKKADEPSWRREGTVWKWHTVHFYITMVRESEREYI